MSLSCFKCPICGSQKFQLQKYLTHVEFAHQHIASFSVACGLNGCPCTYTSVKSLRKHMREKHMELYNSFQIFSTSTSEESDIAIENNYDLDIFEEPNSEIVNNTITESVNKNISIDDILLGLKKHFSMFVLQVGEKHAIPSVVQQEIAAEAHLLLKYFVSNYNEFIKFHLKQSGFEISDDDDLLELLENETLIDRALSAVNSDRKILSYCKSHLGYIAPKPIELTVGNDDDDDDEIPGASDESIDTEGTNAGDLECAVAGNSTEASASNDSDVNENNDSFQYISVLQVITKMVEQKEVWHSIQRKLEKDSVKDPNLLSSYVDGTICKCHDVFTDKNAIRLHLYVDEFEVCNPIGSHRSTHKLCAFYYFLGNVEEQYHSQLKHIHLCLLVKEKYIKKSRTFKQVLQPLIAELEVLYNEGILVNIEGNLIRLYGALATVSADNLSAHAVAGLRRVFNSGRICRQCMILHTEIEKELKESLTLIRTEEMHFYHIKAVSSKNGVSAATYGVEKRCPFLNLPYFKVTESFPPDVMHDVLEGVIPVTLKLVILVLKRIVTIAQINTEIETFSFGRNDIKNKPVLLPVSLGSANISGSASEKLCLFRLLPFLIGYRVPQNDPHWLLYLMLREIVDFLMSPSVSKTVLPYLQLLIEQFLKTFVSLFPGQMKPKFHYLLHYPRLIAQYGPLRYLWCMRFEAKHQYFKKLASACRNFKNIALTLSKRHQLRQCWEFTSLDFFKENNLCSGETSLFFQNLSQHQQTLFLSYFGLHTVPGSEMLWKCNSLTHEGNAFKLNDVCIVGLLHAEGIPLFFKICQIMKFRENWVFLGKILVSTSFSSHYHSFCVDEEREFTLCQPSDLIDHQLLDCYTLQDGQTYVSLKHLVFLS